MVIGRRAFLGGVVASGAMLATGAGIANPAGVRAAGKTTVTRYPLYLPPPIGLASSLTAAPSTVDLGGGNLSKAWAYNGFMPGRRSGRGRGTPRRSC